MYRSDEQLYEMIGRMRQAKGSTSKAAVAPSASKAPAVVKAPCDMMIANNPKRNSGSKAASSTTTEQTTANYKSNGKRYSMLYECRPHNYKTTSMNEFNEHLHQTHTESKTASVNGINNKAKVIFDFLNTKLY